MSTRYLACVVLGGEYKIAQYGQSSGYPASAGIGILRFLTAVDIPMLKDKVSQLRFLSEEESTQKYDEIDNYVKGMSKDEVELLRKEDEDLLLNPSPELYEKYFSRPFIHLHRDLGYKIFDFVMRHSNIPPLQNDINFAGCSLHCEWVYVVDLDKEQFEVYRGLNKESVPPGERFCDFEGYREYFPVKFQHQFALDQLPDESEFLRLCQENEA